SRNWARSCRLAAAAARRARTTWPWYMVLAIAASTAMIATTIISSIRVKPRARRVPAARMRFRSVAIDQFPPGDTSHQRLRAAGHDLRIAAVVQAHVRVRAGEDRVVRAAVVGHARVRGVGVAAVVVAVVANGPAAVHVEERAAEPAAGERVDRHRVAATRGR